MKEDTKENYRNGIMSIMIPLMLVLFISGLDQTIVATALPTISKDLGGLKYVSWVATAYLLTSSITTLLFGKLGDIYGRKSIFQISIGIFLIGSVLSGLASNMFMLIIFRAFQGIGGGALNSLTMAIIGDIVPPRQRSKYQGYTGIVAMIALITGPFLGGFISQYFSWRIIFYINIPIGILAMFMVAIKLKLQVPKKKGKVDIFGGVLATIITTLVLLIATWGGNLYKWNSPIILTLAIVSASLLALYIFVEKRVKEPITPLHLFKSSIFIISSIQFLLATLVLFVVMLYVPMFLQNVGGYSATKAGLFVIPMIVGLTIATILAGQLIAKSGRYKIYPIIGSVMTGVSMYILSLINQNTSVIELIIVLLFSGVGMGFLIQVALLAGQNTVEHKFLGVATGALNFFKSLGGAFGAAIFGAILTTSLATDHTMMANVHSFDKIFFLTVPLMVLSFILGVIMKEKPLSDEMIKVAEGEIEVPEY